MQNSELTTKQGDIQGNIFSIFCDFSVLYLFSLDYCVAHVCVVFTIPKAALSILPPNVQAPQYLAYIELFTPFSTSPHHDHGIYTIKHCLDQEGEYLVAIVQVLDLCSSVHLYPQFRFVAPRSWTSSTVLDSSHSFYISPWSIFHDTVRSTIPLTAPAPSQHIALFAYFNAPWHSTCSTTSDYNIQKVTLHLIICP